MTRLAPTLHAYFTTRLTAELGASPHTVAAYRDTWRLLLGFTAQTRAAGHPSSWTSPKSTRRWSATS